MAVYAQHRLTDNEYASLKSEVRSIVNNLPQRAVIADATAERWIEETCRLEGRRAIWHAHRAATIGGSEAGEFILYAMGKSQAYQSLEDIWEAKMLLRTPQRPTLPMRRGTAMEDLANRVYLKLTGHTSVLGDPDVQAAFNKPHKQHSHIGGNPDEVVNAGSKRLITDFKVRSNLDEDAGISIINGAQLHHYGLLHEGNLGSIPDAYALAELDIPNEMIDSMMANPPEDWDRVAEDIASINRPGFGMKISYTKHNPALANLLVQLTGTFWKKYVMTGQPFVSAKPELPVDITIADQAAITEAQNQYLSHKIAENVAKEKAGHAREALMAIAGKYDLSDWPFERKGLSVGYSQKFVAEAAAKRLISKGVPVSELQKAGKPGSAKPNVEAMIQTLERHGLLGPSHFMPEWDTRAIKAQLKKHDIQAQEFEAKSFRVGITRQKADLSVIETLNTEMANHLDRFLNDDEPPTAINEHSDSEAFDEPTTNTPKLA